MQRAGRNFSADEAIGCPGAARGAREALPLGARNGRTWPQARFSAFRTAS